jgi:hypothetical protein
MPVPTMPQRPMAATSQSVATQSASGSSDALSATGQAPGPFFNQPGNYVIADQFNDRVILVRKTGPTSGEILFTQGMLTRPVAASTCSTRPH